MSTNRLVPAPACSYSQDWHRDANAQRLSDLLELDPHQDGFGSRDVTWEQYPRPAFDEVMFQSAGPNSMQTNADFTLVNADCGALSCTVDNAPEQLAFDLGGLMSDAFGYVVVLGDRGSPSLVWSKMRGAPLRNFEDLRPAGWSFAATNQRLWLAYDYGKIVLGQGSMPGSGVVLLRAFDTMPHPGAAAQIGFGAWHNSDQRLCTVKQVRMWRRRQMQPQLHYAPYARSIGPGIF
jgi:hypothetical protein